MYGLDKRDLVNPAATSAAILPATKRVLLNLRIACHSAETQLEGVIPIWADWSLCLPHALRASGSSPLSIA